MKSSAAGVAVTRSIGVVMGIPSGGAVAVDQKKPSAFGL
jgi:hypothetical protein